MILLDAALPCTHPAARLDREPLVVLYSAVEDPSCQEPCCNGRSSKPNAAVWMLDRWWLNRKLRKGIERHFHFTPTYSSWLNQVEIWFGRIEREVIARAVFSSVRALARK